MLCGPDPDQAFPAHYLRPVFPVVTRVERVEVSGGCGVMNYRIGLVYNSPLAMIIRYQYYFKPTIVKTTLGHYVALRRRSNAIEFARSKYVPIGRD